jgi:hypothetical protein
MRAFEAEQQTMSKAVFLNLTVLVIALIASLLVSEISLRWLGYKPWQYEIVDRSEPTMNQPDAELGWVAKAGHYTVPAYDQTDRPIEYNFYADGSRRTSLATSDDGDQTDLSSDRRVSEIVIVGCSFSQGWAISDNETYSWYLQQKRFTDQKVLNYGTGGYSTYQSLLRLERTLPTLRSPKLVVYGFIRHHEVRNVAPSEWLELLSKFSKRGHVYVPFVTLDKDGKLLRHAPRRYVELPFREYSALVTVIERSIMNLLERSTQYREVTQNLIVDMHKLSELYGARFVVVLLDIGAKDYVRFLKQNDINYIDCSLPIPLPKGMRVAGEGHPNAKANAFWGECIGEAIVLNKLL